MSHIVFHNRFIDDWMSAFPLGNGRIGAMLFGDPNREKIEISEESLWSGKQLEETYVSSKENLDNIRNMLFNEKYVEATQLCKDTLLANPPRVRFFESFGELFVDYSDKNDYKNYKKSLDLSTAIATVEYQKSGINYKSETFISEKYDCFVSKTTADGSFDCSITFLRGQDAETKAEGNTIILDGQLNCPTHEHYGEGFLGMKFGANLQIVSDGEISASGDTVHLTGAKTFTIFANFATNYNIEKFNFDDDIDYKKRLDASIKTVTEADYEEIKASHIADHQKRYNKVSFDLKSDKFTDVPTDERLRRMREENCEDNDLYTLYYNFGRYLLIESSGKNATLPANLQGLWVHGYTPPWGSDYHTNINVQMNYWPADNTNIGESFIPFANYIKKLSEFGKDTAKKLFMASGWTCNHTSDVFGRTGVHDLVDCGFFPMAGPWLCLNLWEHYEFTGDEKYLEDIYPVLKGSCEFVLDFLIEHNGYLVTAPTNSPENSFYYYDNGEQKQSMFTYGATMDFQIIYALFTRTAFAASKLNIDPCFAEKLEKTLEMLPPMKISERYGTICEWIKDYEEVEPGHRHISHLFGLYPSDQITEADPELFAAARNTIERRIENGGGQNGWSRAWATNFYARFKDGAKAFEHFSHLVKTSASTNLLEIYPMAAYPPFQIDGNFGAIASVTEMLIQSHLGKIGERIVEILPALPPCWKTGSIKGIKARGGFVFDIDWDNCKPTKVAVTAEDNAALHLKIAGKTPSSHKAFTVNDKVLVAEFKNGESAVFTF